MKDAYFLKKIDFYSELDKFCSSNSLCYTLLDDYSLGDVVYINYFCIRRSDEYTLYKFNLYSRYTRFSNSEEYKHKYFIDITFPIDLFDENFLQKVYKSNNIKQFEFCKKIDCFTFELMLDDNFNYEELISLLNDYFRCILVIDKFLDEDRFTEFKK